MIQAKTETETGALSFEESDAATVGERIVLAREGMGLSTAQLARRLGVQTRTLAGWERDQSSPRVNRLHMLAGLLNVTPAWLLHGGEGFSPPSQEDNELATIKARVAIARREVKRLSGLLAEIDDHLDGLNDRRDTS